MSGTDNALRITTSGTGLGTTCGATFNILWNNAPICIAQLQTSNTATYISATTTSSFTVTTASTFATGAKINVICRGYE